MRLRTSSCHCAPYHAKIPRNRTDPPSSMRHAIRLERCDGSCLLIWRMPAEIALPRPYPIAVLAPLTNPWKSGLLGSSDGVKDRQKNPRATTRPPKQRRPNKYRAPTLHAGRALGFSGFSSADSWIGAEVGFNVLQLCRSEPASTLRPQRGRWPDAQAWCRVPMRGWGSAQRPHRG